MKKINLTQGSKSEERQKKSMNRNEFIGFVAEQFKKLAKKNLRVPIQLYHL